MRDDLARPRGEFRTVEAGTLPTQRCLKCTRLVYRVPAGMWFHWNTLEEGCQREGTEKPVEAVFGPSVRECGPYPGDTAERGLARAGLSATYRRGSWEWMGCR